MIFVVGLNHRTAPLAVRERLSFGVDTLNLALRDLAAQAGIKEAAILSTCNRTEIYCSAAAPKTVIDWLAAFQQIAPDELAPSLYIHEAAAAITHAFRVASGLDSMVVGEPQILGQMKDAVRTAEESALLGTQLHQLFQRAFSVAKEVRATTAIGANTVSMAAAAVHLSLRIFESIADQHILFIGAGEMIELCAAHFCAKNPKVVTVANRTTVRGQALANRYQGQAIRLDDLGDYLPRHDIIVSCTASPLPIIGLGMAERAIKARRHRPMFMIDLAVPRDIEPEIGELDDVFLYTVDDLAAIVESGMESRQAAVIEAESIIQSRVSDFLSWQASRETVPIIRNLRDHADRMRRHELEHALKCLQKGDAADSVLESLSQRLTNKFLHAPTHALNIAEGKERQALKEAVSRLFHLHQD